MPTVTLDEIERHHPDVLLPPDPEFADDYREMCKRGREIAAETSVAFVFLARNAMPWLPRTLDMLEQTAACFKSWSAFAMENDSADETKDVLAAWQDGQQRHASLNNYGRPHLNFTKVQARTHALAQYRNACVQFVKNGELPDHVIVFDADPFGGWSIDGVMNSVGHISSGKWWGLASYSWCEMRTNDGSVVPAHYDAWACRWTWWQERSHDWFFMYHPPVGSRPVEMNSAFGQLAVYDGKHFVRGVYSGDTCEHVPYHRSIAEHRETRGKFGLNPSSRVVSFWDMNHGGG
jgi:hypothetical protein